MIKIGILTWLHNGNYGTILQAYALQRFLRDEGYNVQNIDLHPTIIERTKNLIKQRNPLSLFLEKYEVYKMKIACTDSEKLKLRQEKQKDFLVNGLNLTQKYRKFSDLSELGKTFDIYICGSDQIWSPTYFSPSYFFDFVSDEKKKIAYACSFGISHMPKSKFERMKCLIKRFDCISVRETTGANIVNELMGQRPIVNIDPTMLLNSGEWDIICSKRIINEKYLFCFFLTYNQAYQNTVQRIAEEKGLKVVIIPMTKESYRCSSKQIIDAGPSDFLGLIKYADFIATDSFHVCVFSIIYQKNFFVFKRFNDNKKDSRNVRVYNLLNMFGLERCIVENADNYIPIQISNKEYRLIENRMQELSSKSKEWLLNAINE